MPRSLVLSLYGAFCVLTLLMLGTPLVLARPPVSVIGGLPFPIAWSVLWVLMAFVVLGTTHVLAGGEAEE
jgi:hypothetical protein